MVPEGIFDLDAGSGGKERCRELVIFSLGPEDG